MSTLSELHVRMLDAAGDRTFRSVATMTGQNHETVRRYMQGAAPSVDFISAFCEAFGLNANWLLTGRGPMKAAEMRGDALTQANPTELLTATAGTLEKLDDRVDRLEVFVSTMESRIRASVARRPSDGDASAEKDDDGSPHGRSTQDTAGDAAREGKGRADRAGSVADALRERPCEDDR